MNWCGTDRCTTATHTGVLFYVYCTRNDITIQCLGLFRAWLILLPTPNRNCVYMCVAWWVLIRFLSAIITLLYAWMTADYAMKEWPCASNTVLMRVIIACQECYHELMWTNAIVFVWPVIVVFIMYVTSCVYVILPTVCYCCFTEYAFNCLCCLYLEVFILNLKAFRA